jgi:hypothetical protein
MKGDSETINQAKTDAKIIEDLFKNKSEFEVEGSGNYIQYLDFDAKTLAEALPYFNYIESETPGIKLEGNRAQDHDREFKALLDGKVENVSLTTPTWFNLQLQPTEKLLKMKEAHLDGKKIKYVQFGHGNYSTLAFARESAMIIAIGKLKCWIINFNLF